MRHILLHDNTWMTPAAYFLAVAVLLAIALVTREPRAAFRPQTGYRPGQEVNCSAAGSLACVLLRVHPRNPGGTDPRRMMWHKLPDLLSNN